MRLLRLMSLAIRKNWDDLADRYGLRRLPPGLAVTAVLAAGVLVPLAFAMKRTPADLSPSLAQERLAKYARLHGDALPTFGPEGTILSDRPAFYWPGVPGAARYVFRLVGPDGPRLTPDPVLEANRYRMASPGKLSPGSYRFEVEALDAAGATLLRRQGRFDVAEPTEELAELRRSARFEFHTAPASAALVLMGYYASKDSPHDVAAEAFTYRGARNDRTPALEGAAAIWFESAFGN